MDSFAIISYYIHAERDTRLVPSGLANVFYVFAVISFLLSFILLFFGKRLLRLSLGIIGLISFGSVPFWIYLVNGFYISSITLLAIMLVIGIVAAFIVSYFTRFGIYIIGATSGVQFGYLLSEIIYQGNIVLFITLAILFGLAGLILPYFLMSYMVVEITTFNGFLLFRCAIQYIVIGIYMKDYTSSSIQYDSGTYWGILFGSLFFSCLGIFWQYYKYKNYPYLKSMESNQTFNEEV